MRLSEGKSSSDNPSPPFTFFFLLFFFLGLFTWFFALNFTPIKCFDDKTCTSRKSSAESLQRTRRENIYGDRKKCTARACKFSTRPIRSSVKKQLNIFELHALPTFTTSEHCFRLARSECKCVSSCNAEIKEEISSFGEENICEFCNLLSNLLTLSN